MNITKQKRILLLLLAALLVHGCSNREENEPELPYDPLDPKGFFLFISNLEKAPVALTDDFPEWLQIFWNNLKGHPGSGSICGKLVLFQGEWKDQTVFYILFDMFYAPITSTVYYSDGTIVDWEGWEKGDEVIRDFCYTSKNWKKICEYESYVPT
jgi:hypothetical protein